MTMPQFTQGAIIVACVAMLVTYIYGPTITRSWVLLGVSRVSVNTVVDDGDFVVVEDTTHCEDLHYHAATRSIFTACEDSAETRYSWFPALGILADPLVGQAARGSLHVIDVETKRSKRLSFVNFDSTFVSHGLDVISDPRRPGEAVYIFAVNHLPDPDFVKATLNTREGKDVKLPTVKTASQLEIFHHVLGSSSVRHVRSIEHPLITTPNDIYAKDPSSIFVTNDHFYREGHLRLLEDLNPRARWTNVVHIKVLDMESTNAAAGIQVNIAHSGLHNNNGLSHGSRDEVLLVSCGSGVLHLASLSGDQKSPKMLIKEIVEVDSFVDNPSWFDDPFRSEVFDASGYVLPGVSRPLEVANSIEHPAFNISSIVWYVKRKRDCQARDRSSSCWEKILLFEDDGSRISAASAAVLVPIEPEPEEVGREAWLFISGFLSRNTVAVKAEL